MLMTAVPLVLIMVPGEWVFTSQQKTDQAWFDACRKLREETEQQLETMENNFGIVSRYVSVYEHGWPSAYMSRACVKEDLPDPPGWPKAMDNIFWCHTESWPFASANWIFRPWAFLLDLSLALALIGGVGGLTQWRICRRGGLLKFNLTDLWVALAILGIGLGYCSYHCRIYDRELRPPRENHSGAPLTLWGEESLGTLQGYAGPVWLWKLCGGGDRLGVFWHNSSARILPDKDWRANYNQLPTFPYLVNIDIDEAMPLDAVKQLKECSRIQRLVLPPFEPDDPTVVEGTSDPLFRPEHLSRLRDMNVRFIVLRGSSIEAKHVEMVAEFSGIETISLLYTSVTENEEVSLQKHYPDVKIEIVEYY